MVQRCVRKTAEQTGVAAIIRLGHWGDFCCHKLRELLHLKPILFTLALPYCVVSTYPTATTVLSLSPCSWTQHWSNVGDCAFSKWWGPLAALQLGCGQELVIRHLIHTCGKEATVGERAHQVCIGLSCSGHYWILHTSMPHTIEITNLL